MLAGGAVATSDTTFQISDKYVVSNGTQINSCDNISGWSNGSINTTTFHEGTGSLQLQSGSVVQISTAHNFSADQNYVLWVYIDNIDTFSSMSFRFSKASNIYDCMIWSPGGTVGRFNAGWNAFVFSKSDFTAAGTGSWNESLTTIGISIIAKSGMSTTVLIDDIRVNYTGTPTCVMTFDDGAASVYDIAYPIMRERGLVGTCFVCPNLIGSSDAFYMNLSELHELQDSGWEISSHTMSHADLTTLSNTDLRYQLNSSFDWLVSNGFREKPARLLSYPGGKFNDNVINAASDVYHLARTVNTSINEIHIPIEQDIRMKLKQKEPTNLVSADSINSTLAKCVQQCGMQIFMYHRFTTGEEELESISVDRFTAQCDGIVASGAENVLLSSYLDEVAPRYHPISGETVQIYSSGLSLVTSDHIYPDQKVNMTVLPSNDSVNVTISTWTPDQKIWDESSESPGISVTHTIGDLPVNANVNIYRDGAYYDTATTNSTGYIEWVYDGGFSEHEFSIDISNFDASPLSGTAPLSVLFSNASQNVTSWYWDFENDGKIDSTKRNPVHTYGQPGNYSVNLTVKNEYGNFSTVKTDYITVSAQTPPSTLSELYWWLRGYLGWLLTFQAVVS